MSRFGETLNGGEKKAPRYLQVMNSIRGSIVKGEFKEADFPTESELCETFSVSRFTVREALRVLQDEGLIQRRRGSGTVVHSAAARGGALHQPLSNVAEILQYARNTIFKFDAKGEVGLPIGLAQQIGLIAGGSWTHFSGVRRQIDSSSAIAFTEVFLSESVKGAAAKIKLEEDTIFRQIERLAKIKFIRVTQDIQAVAAANNIARELGIARNSPCLRITRCYIDAADRIIEISVSYHPGKTFAYNMHIEI